MTEEIKLLLESADLWFFTIGLFLGINITLIMTLLIKKLHDHKWHNK